MLLVRNIESSQDGAVQSVREAPVEKASETEMTARIRMLQQQRNEALEQVVLMAGQIATLQEQLAQLTKDLIESSKRRES